tara:strand:+ start:94 stop:1092 length:999 start_codon:yes stop_codon:yes gene_type:complete
MEIIAEIAQGFEGNFNLAKKLVVDSSKTGADYVKFHLIYADELATEDYKHYKFLKKLEMKDLQWRKLNFIARKKNIKLIFDVFGEKSLNLALKLKTKKIKIHSTDLMNRDLIKNISKSKIKEVILGCGGANKKEILLAYKFLKRKKLTFMTGFQSYPTPDSSNQISRISYLKNLFRSKKGINFGFADHADPTKDLKYALSASAIGAGASVIEKHFTLDRKLKLEDFETAFNKYEFKKFSKIIRNCFLAFGNTKEKKDDFGMHSKEYLYKRMTRRNIVAKFELKKNSILKRSDFILRRSSSKYSIKDFSKILGKRLLNKKKKNSSITKKDIFK